VFSITPWRGNIIDFALILLPVAASSILIRTFIQKWVIEKKERGFHIVGGLLHINSWWVYLLGLFYTIINKNVPYLPTPKENEWNTNYKIVIPNMMVAALSIFAVIYGLEKDLTPYSLIMAGFALFNAIIMVFGVYLAHRVTNQNQILRSRLKRKNVQLLWRVKEKFFELGNVSFSGIRKISLPLLLILIIVSMGFKNENELSKWKKVEAPVSYKVSPNYLGIFHPISETGLSDLSEIEYIENAEDIDFNIISFYLGWNPESIENFPHDLMRGSYNRQAIPMITWEPWASALPQNENYEELSEEKKVMKYIAQGVYDDYIREFIQILKSYDQPVFLRFAHEFDNPQYPWSQVGENTPEEFVNAWKHVHSIMQEENARKIIFVWNPWTIEGMTQFYPGDEYVDWIGITLLNYDSFNPRGNEYSFRELYEPIHEKLKSFTRKPVMLTEFGSLDLNENQEEWLIDAMTSIREDFSEISGIVIFNSAFDANIPENNWYKEKYLDWTTKHLKHIKNEFSGDHKFTNLTLSSVNREFSSSPTSNLNFKGINYKKAKRWQNTYYHLSKDVLEKDFKLMRDAGINTIKINPSPIYDYNLRKYSKKFGLNLIYQFEAKDVSNFITDHKNLNKSKESILERIREFKNDDYIIGYSFVFNFENYFHKPFLFEQEAGYLYWLNNLATEIKSIDSTTPVILEMDFKKGMESEISWLHNHLSVDFFGLRVKDTLGLQNLFKYSEEQGISIFINNLDTNTFLQSPDKFKDINIVLSNFQDEHYSNWVTFDGIVDIYGHPRRLYAEVKNIFTRDPVKPAKIYPKILRPAEALVPGNTARYNAYIFQNDEWVTGQSANEDYIFEWTLIKTDEYGNPLAIKKLGTGIFIDVNIPENYENYSLMLTSVNRRNGLSQSDTSVLYTPTSNSDSNIYEPGIK